MAAVLEKILVIGTGKVGALVGTLLHESGFNVKGFDHNSPDDLCFEVMSGDCTDAAQLNAILPSYHAVVSCLPYNLNIVIASVAHALGIHYFDLTEDVPTMNAIREMAKTAKSVMAPQCGLAPGFIGIVGADLAHRFDQLRSVELRVGALPQHPKGLLGYAFNWSPEGVVNEYLNDCEVIKDGHTKKVPALQDQETVWINGVEMEACTTSGGLGTMCETFAGKVDELNYKTLRYPGHFKQMRFFFHELLMAKERKRAGEILVNAKPPVNEDVVYVHAAAEGWKRRSHNGNNALLSREEFVHAYYPITVQNRQWRAISWTTAASVTAVVEMVRQGTLPDHGYIKQEEIPLKDFLLTKAGSLYNIKN